MEEQGEVQMELELKGHKGCIKGFGVTESIGEVVDMNGSSDLGEVCLPVGSTWKTPVTGDENANVPKKGKVDPS